jgi:hypothetical protein
VSGMSAPTRAPSAMAVPAMRPLANPAIAAAYSPDLIIIQLP